jgi:group I intron endonuclease
MPVVKSNIFYTYSLSDPDTNIPFYIGKGYGDRLYYHENAIKSGKTFYNLHLKNKIQKILLSGKSIIYTKIVENVDEQVALETEKEQILKIGRADLNNGPLCNLTDGGEGVSGIMCSEKTRRKRSELVRGEKNPMFNRRHTPESVSIISKKKKDRDTHYTYKHDESHKENMKIYNPGGIKTSKPIHQLDENGILLHTWPSARAAAKAVGASHGNISLSATKKTNWKVKGFYWRLA